MVFLPFVSVALSFCLFLLLVSFLFVSSFSAPLVHLLLLTAAFSCSVEEGNSEQDHHDFMARVHCEEPCDRHTHTTAQNMGTQLICSFLNVTPLSYLAHIKAKEVCNQYAMFFLLFTYLSPRSTLNETLWIFCSCLYVVFSTKTSHLTLSTFRRARWMPLLVNCTTTASTTVSKHGVSMVCVCVPFCVFVGQ